MSRNLQKKTHDNLSYFFCDANQSLDSILEHLSRQLDCDVYTKIGSNYQFKVNLFQLVATAVVHDLRTKERLLNV